VLAYFINIKETIFITVALSFIHYLILGIRSRNSLRFEKTLLIFMSNIVGMLLGTLLFVYIHQETLKLLSGVVIFSSGLLLSIGCFPAIGEGRCTKLLVGLTGGVLQTMTGMGGPPFVIYFSSQHLKKEEFRAIAITLFLMMCGVSFFMLAMTGIVTRSILTYVSIFLPSLIIGYKVGQRLVGVINDRVFKWTVHLLIIISGLILIMNAYR
jgi:uncharacterized membrane protein YfcA